MAGTFGGPFILFNPLGKERMKHYSIELRAVSPLAIRSDHAPGGAATIHFITGTTLMGSLAATHRMLRSKRTDEFESLFLSDRIQYPNLYQAIFLDKGMQESQFPVYPIPKTAQTCKRFPGFHKLEDEQSGEERHGVHDGLLDWAIFKLSNGMRYRRGDIAALEALQRHKLCQYNTSDKPSTYQPCDTTMDHFDGYYRRENYEPYKKISAQI